MTNSNKKYGFTLIELMVTVIIIAILVAIAIPQYKHVVLKSRFSKVMPVAKSVADAQEVYYLGNGGYAPQTNQLDVEPITGGEITVALSETDGYDYVMAQHSKVPGARYIMYQKHSENYPSEIHCEAEKDNADAEWLCGSLSNNNNIGEILNGDYITYIVEGTGAGFAPGADGDNTNENGEVVPGCENATALGYTCNITTNEAGQQEKKICYNGVCRTKTYNEDGSYTSVTCNVDDTGVCISASYSWYSSTYDANGNKIARRGCDTVTEEGGCSAYNKYLSYDYVYDANGNKIAERMCDTFNADGSCATYMTYNAYDYAYDANGKMISKRACATFTADGSKCATYSTYGIKTDYIYDANGDMTSERDCKTLNSDGTCATYNSSSSANKDYTYDANGNQTAKRTCNTLTSDGSKCATYSTSSQSQQDYTYDANGNKTSQRSCKTLTSDGSKCATYESSGNYDYTYDTNGRLISERYCATVTSNGSCATYTSGGSVYYTYDANGTRIQLYCSNVNSAGECTSYSSANFTGYDEDGKQLYTASSCSDFNTTTGECSAYGTYKPASNE